MNNKDLSHILGYDVEDIKKRNARLEKFIAQKNKERELKSLRVIEKIEDVPKDMLFSKNTIWKAINLETFELFEFTGNLVRFYLTNRENIRKMLESGVIEAFEAGKFYIKFFRFYC